MKEGQKKENTEFEILGSSWDEAEMPEDLEERIAALEKYNYFDGTSIRKSIKVSEQVYTRGRKLFEQGQLILENIESRFDDYRGETLGRIYGKGLEGKKEFNLYASFDRTKILEMHCGCSKCRGDYFSRYSNKTECPYKAGMLEKLEGYLNGHNLGDVTDREAFYFINFYQKKRRNQVQTGSVSANTKLTFLPRLTQKDGELLLSFKIGADKLFVVKKLDEFCINVKNAATDTYGSSTQINHNIENFSEKGKKWLKFLNGIVREETVFLQRMYESNHYYGYQRSSIGNSVMLYGARLDEFYKLLENDSIEYEDKDRQKKTKVTLTCQKANPKVTMQISAEKMRNDKNFHGIRVSGDIPELYYGTEFAYFIEGNHFSRVEPEYLDKIRSLSSVSEDGFFSFCIGRNYMSEFYNQILPQLEDVVEVTETEPEKFRKYILPEARFIFYLDAQNQNVSCRAYAIYGNKEVSLLDGLRSNMPETIESTEVYRDMAHEEEVVQQLLELMPNIDWEQQEFHCGEKEELVFQMMETGTEKLQEIGEVRCTKRFRDTNKVKPMKVSVGVSVSSGLLELDIATDDVPYQELLDILNSYRAKKKYHRLKDGSFVNVEDASLEMLNELMESMHLKPKEFIQGKMHLPMYRTLYLDKMLEENEEVYSNRDSHFKKIVKGFKTVKDADFEEPSSLAKIMRKYQKDGYKWLRTLETWQFGGILADDMGLGKTLQMIAVLLAAKLEGREGTSLIVVPASLVFNWGEELKRFAPELTVSLITGTQEERKEKIEAYQNADVLVTSYDLLKRDIALYEEKQFSYEIIDEAQYIKNHTTAAAKAVKVIKSRIRFALTGTPIENRLSELWSIFDYLMPGFLYGYDSFKKEMETPIVKKNDEETMKRLQKMVAPFILRRLKEDVLKDLPEKLEEYRYVQFESTQQKLYDAQVVHMKERLASQNEEDFNKNKLQILAELTRLRQICCAPSLCFENYKGEAAKVDVCIQLIQSAIDGGHRMLVFSQFTSMLEILQKELDDAGISYYVITGSTAKEKRLQMVKEFNEGEVPVFLISLKAGGVGLNLTGADMVIHYDPWWNQAAENQATDRAHRIGQKKKVTVYKLIAKNTIEEKIKELQEKKKNLAEQVISGDMGQLGAMTRQELLELLGV